MFPRIRYGWPALTALSIAAAFAVGIVEWIGLAFILVFAGACVAAVRSTFSTAVRGLAWVVLVVCGIALASHQVPWINNVLVFEAMTLSSSSVPYTLYWNYDKALAGVLVYAVCVQPQRRTKWSRAVLTTAMIAVVTPVLLIPPALAMGFVHWDPKLPTILVMWVPANLLVTCLAEETFFRGLLQRYLAEALSNKVPSAALVALFVSAVVFGISHIGGGIAYVALATLAGIGYGAAYHFTQRVEASILVHFTVNLVHLTFFTYPSVV